MGNLIIVITLSLILLISISYLIKIRRLERVGAKLKVPRNPEIFIPIVLGSCFGNLTCFLFYKVKGIKNTLSSPEPWMGQFADLLCIMAFVAAGIFFFDRFIQISRSFGWRASRDK